MVGIGKILSPKNPAIAATTKANHITKIVFHGTKIPKIARTNDVIPKPIAIIIPFHKHGSFNL